MRKSEGNIKLVNLNRRNIELLVMTKLATVFEIFTDEQDAVSSYYPDRKIKTFDILSLSSTRDEAGRGNSVRTLLKRRLLFLLPSVRSAPLLLAVGSASLPGSGKPAFEVASTVKPSSPAASDLIDINLGTANHGVVTLGNVTLSECIRWAYGLVSEEQVTGPAWLRTASCASISTAKSAHPIRRMRDSFAS